MSDETTNTEFSVGWIEPDTPVEDDEYVDYNDLALTEKAKDDALEE